MFQHKIISYDKLNFDDLRGFSDVHVMERKKEELVLIKRTPAPRTLTIVPEKVDLSQHLRFVRKQGGYGCWGYATLAVWDIMNEMACPFSPNLSLNLWLYTYRITWQCKKTDPFGLGCVKDHIVSPDGRRYNLAFTIVDKQGKMKIIHSLERGFFQDHGCPTEGTDLTRSYCTWHSEAVNEAQNFRLADSPKRIIVNSNSFTKWLAAGYPIRAYIPSHVIAIVGYDQENKKFKYVDTKGDKEGAGGYFWYTFDEINSGKVVEDAEILKIIPPRPVPAVRIRFTHTNRLNVSLWLSAEDGPFKKRIWPTFQHYDWDENSANLHFTVRLPSEFIWPPSSKNRLVLDLHDTAEFSSSGGKLEEFTAAFGGHVIKCPDLKKGPIAFKPHQHLRVWIH